MGLITTIFNLFGCSSQRNTDNGSSKELDEKIANSIDAFRNRIIYRDLSSEIIDSISDDNLLQIVFDNLWSKLPTNYEEEYKAVMSWNKSRQAIYIIWILEAEVNNGGFNQFYFNSSGQFYKNLPDALNLVGAIKFADLTRRANKTFEKEFNQITEHQDGTLDGFSQSYDDNPLNEFDEEFYSLYQTEKLDEIQVNFIRKHKNDFIDK